MTRKLFIPDLLNPAAPDPVAEAEREAHLAAYPDPRSYEATKAWKDAHPDQKAPVRRTGSVLGALFKALEDDPDSERMAREDRRDP